MPLVPGSRLGHYSISALLGKGGMGEVYRATDTNLHRDVAIKVLPEEFTGDAERLARFEREARVLAGLNHSAIAAIYGIEQANGLPFLVMELAEGGTLGDRLEAGGGLPLSESIAVAAQIADALDAAHEKGVVHRDLKPANIVVDEDGRVKVLDFGLARAIESDGVDQNLSQSPTMARATRAGIILGTAAYMSPEQARGRRVDKRADIWSLGVILWEMLTGRRLFEGETVSDTLASVLTTPIDLTVLPPGTPRTLVWLLERCLERDPKKRLRDAGDARLILDGAWPETSTTPVRSRLTLKERIAWAAALLMVIMAATFLVIRRRESESGNRVLHAFLPLPPGSRLALTGLQPGPPAVSPDGRRIAFVAEESGGLRRLWVRAIDAARAQVLEGTDRASYPFWSPDSKNIAFFADGRLKRVPAAGGPVLTVTSAPNPKGGTWNREGIILFCPKFDAPLFRVPASGGTAEPVTRLDLAAGDSSHRFPQFLSDGRRFLYTVRKHGDTLNVTMLGSLDGRERPRVIIESRFNAIFAAGRLLYLRDLTLMAQRFDEKSGALTGTATVMAENVRVISGAARGVVAAADDLLLFQTGEYVEKYQLMWVDRAGRNIADIGEPDLFADYSISPDGTRIATEVLDPSSGTFDLWIFDATSGNRQRLTFDPASEMTPVWSPDGNRLVYHTNAHGKWELVIEDLRQRGAVRTLLAATNQNENPIPYAWSPDGKFLIYATEKMTGNSTSILLLDLSSGKVSLLTEVEVRDPNLSFSPDGRWVSFQTLNASGQPSIFVARFPDLTRRWQVAIGSQPFWRKDGRELFYQDVQSQLWSVPVQLHGDVFAWGPATRWFATEGTLVRNDGDRFLVLRNPDTAAGDEPLELIANWTRLAPP